MSFESGGRRSAPDDPDVNAYKLMTAIVVPRPIAWVTTLSSEGVVNLAPHSFYTVACARPPIVQFTSVGKKDTLRNVRATGEFVVNLAHGPLIEAVNNSSAAFDPSASEAAAARHHDGAERGGAATPRPPTPRRPSSARCTAPTSSATRRSCSATSD